MPTATVILEKCPTRLDTQETYAVDRSAKIVRFKHGLPGTYHAFRHSSWLPIRKRTQRALKAAWFSRSQQSRFQACGSAATLHRNTEDPTKYQIRSIKCHSRWCIPCSRERGRSIAATLGDIVGNKQVRFITLTLRTHDEPLKESLDLLSKSFSRLRSSPLWKTTQTGGAAFLEIKWNPDKERWHPHLHIIAEGKFIPKQDLSNAWTRASHGSFIVDVKLVHSRDNLCSYITKYVTKAVSTSVYRDHERFVEAMTAMEGKRTCTTFGTWRGHALVVKPPEGAWEYLCDWETAIARADTNPWCIEAQAIRALTQPQTPTDWSHNDRAPPKTSHETLWYDYSQA